MKSDDSAFAPKPLPSTSTLASSGTQYLADESVRQVVHEMYGIRIGSVITCVRCGQEAATHITLAHTGEIRSVSTQVALAPLFYCPARKSRFEIDFSAVCAHRAIRRQAEQTATGAKRVAKTNVKPVALDASVLEILGL